MRRHIVEALAAFSAAVVMTLVIAAPVVRAPSERIFGDEIVGRHHDPFTVMQQFERPGSLGLYAQPVTDLTGAAIARLTGAVAAYNWLVLLSFPLSAAAAYLLARHLALPAAGALLAALLFAFSPFHVAHAAYHPHVAQTQWLPLYLLALWRCLDEATWVAVAALAIATAAVTLSNFYGGLIAAVITPVAIGAYWLARARFAPHPLRHLGVTVAALAGLASAGLAFVWWQAPSLFRNPTALAFPREDLLSYSAKWWSYLVPPVAHPLLGAFARRIWKAAQVGDGLLEQQVSLGWGVMALGLVAIAGWLLPRAVFPAAGVSAPLGARPGHESRLAAVPILAAVAAAALICSLSPAWTMIRPSAALYLIVPMFRSYARFAAVVQLMAALLAGIGAARLITHGTRLSRGVAAALVVLSIADYLVWPPALWRDVLPTAAHRWVMQQTNGSRVLDCAPLTAESASIAWLTHGRIALAGADDDCAEPQLAARLWAAGFTHLLVRDTWERQWLRGRGHAEGLQLQARFADADIFSMKPRELVYTREISGFWPREHGNGDSWRWMGADASWTIVAPMPRNRVMLEVDMHAFHVTRPLAVRLDAGAEQSFAVDEDSRTYRIGPLALAAGSHRLTFHSAAPATPADQVIGNGDRRALAISMGAWKWSAE